MALVTGAIQFDSEPRVFTIEIEDSISHGALPSELETRQTSIAQRPPKLLFRGCRFLA
jgi:hypothetical protein